MNEVDKADGARARELLLATVRAVGQDGGPLEVQVAAATMSAVSATYVDLEVPSDCARGSWTDGPMDISFHVFDPSAHLVGEVLIWANDGRLEFLEQSWFTDSPPTEWPGMKGVELAVNHLGPVRGTAADALLIVPIPGKQGWAERLPCARVDSNTYEVGCNPFFLEDIAIGDHLECPSSLGSHDYIEGVPFRSGVSSWRRSLPGSALRRRTEVTNSLVRLGADVEWWHAGGLLSASCRDASQKTAITSLLSDLS